MAYDEQLANAIRDLVAARRDITERKMFGGVCFFLNGTMLCGVGNQLNSNGGFYE